MLHFILITIFLIIIIVVLADTKHAISHGAWGFAPRQKVGLDKWRQDNILSEARELLKKRSSTELGNCQANNYDHYVMRELLDCGLDWDTAKAEINIMEQEKFFKSLSEESKEFFRTNRLRHEREIDKQAFKWNAIHHQSPGTLKVLWRLCMKYKNEFVYISEIGKGIANYHEKIGIGGFLRTAAISHLVKQFRISKGEADNILTLYIEEKKND